MLPIALSLRNLRSFAGPQEIELRPITLLFGRNSSGKSAIVRALPLVADSIDNGLDALHVDKRLKPFDLDFDSLRWKDRAEGDDRGIGIALRWGLGAGLSRMSWSIVEHDDWHRLVVEKLAIDLLEGGNEIEAEWLLSRGEEAQTSLTYNCVVSGTKHRAPIMWRGLLPSADFIPNEVSSRLQELASSILWLHSLRPAPRRYTPWRAAARWSLEPDGSDAPIVLAAEPEVLKRVSSFYEEHFGVELIVEEPRKREVRTLIRRKSRKAAKPFVVDLVDTGEGLSECLPVLTALAMIERHRERSGPSLLAIEEPGAHLHPDLQNALAQRVCEVVKGSQGCVVMETHSPDTLWTVKLNVAKGLLKPEDVVLYWVRQLPDGTSVADRVELDAFARFRGNWPPDAFLQTIDLAARVQDFRAKLRKL